MNITSETPKKIRAVLVDDEQLARQVLREFVAAHADMEIVAECSNGFEAVKAVTEQKPDLIFLDVQMPKLDGFEVLELIGRETAVVFVTAYDNYAIKAFEVHAVDYLLKPFSSDRLAVREGSQVSIIPVAKLDYAEAQDDYVALASAGKKHLKQQTISNLETSLDPARFMRIHRSYIVNLERVAKVEPYGKDTHVAVLSTGVQIPVSRAGYARLKTFLDR
jgi:two-component system LytT family response regulator